MDGRDNFSDTREGLEHALSGPLNARQLREMKRNMDQHVSNETEAVMDGMIRDAERGIIITRQTLNARLRMRRLDPLPQP